MYVQVSHQLALHVACSRPGPGTLQIVQQILRWSSKDIRLTADRVTTIIVLCSCNKIIAKSKLLNYVNSCWSSIEYTVSQKTSHLWLAITLTHVKGY